MEFKVLDLGLMDYQDVCWFQKEVHRAVREGLETGALILCRHYPVITIGRSTKKENILVSGYELKNKGIDVYAIERGGDVTYHGPGQVTVYPIFNLNHLRRDIHWYLRQLEEVVIDLLADFGIEASRRPDLTGVWVGEEKIASIGIAIKNWITFHGLSINIKKSDLENFHFIRPCGMDLEMTSLEARLGRSIEVETIKETLIAKFKDFFTPSVVLCTPYSLRV